MRFAHVRIFAMVMWIPFLYSILYNARTVKCIVTGKKYNLIILSLDIHS